MKLHIDQPRRVVGALQKSAQAQKVKRFVLQHGSGRHAARQVGAEFDPFQELARVALEVAIVQQADDFEPGLVGCFPYFGGQRAANGAGIFARIFQA